MCVTHCLPLAHCVIVTHLGQRFIANLNIFLKHLDKKCNNDMCLVVGNFSYHWFVCNPTALIKASLALLLLCGDIVSDEGVMALLAKGVLALDLLLIDGLLHLHHLVDAPHLLLLTFSLLSGIKLRLGCKLIGFWIHSWICSHGISKLVK